MKKLFYISLAIFFITGAGLFYIVDKNYVTLKSKFSSENLNELNNSDYKPEEEVTTIEKEYSINSEKLDIRLGVGNISIETYDGNSIKIKSIIPKKDLKDYKLSEENKSLNIDASVAKEIAVKLPKDKFMEGTLTVGVGNISAENLKNAIIDLGTGNFEGRNFDGVQMLKVTLGDLELHGSKNVSTIKTGTGDTYLELMEQEKDFLIDNGLGDIELKITNKFEGSVNPHVGLGDFEERNLNTKGGKFKGTVNLGTGNLTIEGVN